MLISANGQSARPTGIGDEFHALMAEVVALRAILLNVLFRQANGSGRRPKICGSSTGPTRTS